MRKSVLSLMILFATATAFGAVWPQKYNNGRHTLFTTAPAITTPGVFWVMDDIPTSSEGSTCTVIGNNNDIYCVRYDGTSYSIVELDRKGQVQRTYLSSSSVAVNSLAVSTTNLYASFDDGTFQAWVLGNTDINWSKTDDNIVSVVLLDDSGNVYFNSDTTVYSYEADGTDRWSYDISATSAGYWPAYYGGAVFVTYDNKMIALNTSNGSKRWLKDMSTWSSDWQYFTWPMIGPDGTIWTGRVADDTLQDYVTLSSSSGSADLGIYPPGSGSYLTSITNAKMLVFAGDGYLAGGTYDMGDLTVTEEFYVSTGFTPTTMITIAGDTIYEGNSSGNLLAHDTTDGSKKWSFPLEMDDAYAVGVMAADKYGTLYIQLSDGRLAAVGESPVAVASGPTSAQPGVPVTFSSAGSGPGISTDTIMYVWDFGDATTSTEANPTHTYATAGNYNVVLTVISNETGAVVTDTIAFVADDMPPTVTLTHAELWGTVDDMYAPPTITVKGITVPVDPTLHTWDSGWIPLETSGPTDVDVVATDASGNTRTVVVNFAP